MVTTCSPRPMRAAQRARVVRHHLDGQPGGVGGEAARGEMVQSHAVLVSSHSKCNTWSSRVSAGVR